MLVSMTGYGRAERENNKFTFNVEIKSLNNRFVDVILRTNLQNLNYEEEIISNIKKKCVRGRVNVNINVSLNNGNSDMMVLNSSKLNSYLNVIKKIKRETGLKDEVSLNNLLNIPDVINKQDSGDISLKYKTLIIRTVRAALRDLDDYRKIEGKNTFNDIKNILKKINAIVEKINSIANTHTKKEVNFYKKKIKSFLPVINKLDNDRVYQEIAIIMEKKDINEEIIRLKSHMKLFNIYLMNKEYVGKKMNFLLQEMFREINTIGSKSDKVKINHYVVDVKDNLEKIKEQVQNIL